MPTTCAKVETTASQFDWQIAKRLFLLYSESGRSRRRQEDIGYKYDALTDKWHIDDLAADYIFCANTSVEFALPGTLQVINYYEACKHSADKEK